MITIFKKLFGSKREERHSFVDMIPEFQSYLKRDDLIECGPHSRPQGEFKGNPMSVLSVWQKLSLLPILLRNFAELKRSFRGIDQQSTRDRLEGQELQRLEEYADSLGVIKMGYVQVDRDDIFQGFKLLFDKAIVFSIEMELSEIQKAPSFDTLHMIQNTYARTGIVANAIAKHLRDHGFAAHAGPGLGGIAIYPLLALKAGMGKFGSHGNLLIEGYGARHRLGVVYTNIENLPLAPMDLADYKHPFCEKCGVCIRKCPAGAIHETPIRTTAENVEFMDNDTCVMEFAKQFGCTVCIRVCPLSQKSIVPR